MRYLASHAPCVLLDPVCAVPRVVDDGVLPRDVALLIGLDASGYDTDAEGHYLSRLAPGINARKVRELGGTGGKIMVYLRADHPHANGHNLAIIRECIEDFAREDLLLVVEFLTYALPGEDVAAYKAKFPSLIEGGTRLCLDAGAKVLKLPYPGTAQSCAAITAMCGPVPWSVLSAGVDHDTFLGQVEIAMANGAAGVIAGRALWKDCVFLDRARQRETLVGKAVPRLKQIQAILDRYPRARSPYRGVKWPRPRPSASMSAARMSVRRAFRRPAKSSPGRAANGNGGTGAGSRADWRTGAVSG